MDITNELLAAYAAGNVSASERQVVRLYLVDHPEELESVMVMMDDDFDIQLGNAVPSSSFDKELGALLDEVELEEPKTTTSSGSILPLMSKAAQNMIDNLCVIRCEGYALRALGFVVSDDELEKEAKEKGWLQAEGIPLHCIGFLSEKRGLYVSRRYGCSINEILRAVKKGEIVIAAIDNAELNQSPEEAKKIDLLNGKTANHAVVIESVDTNKEEINILEPSISISPKTYPIDIFQNAWDDSSNYLVILSNQSNYEPHPLDLDDVTIEPELMELREAIAENAHEVWAKTRKDQGWSYGSERDDAKKLHPDMIPYNLLPESEKEYDRQMAINTIKLVKKLGWELKKRK